MALVLALPAARYVSGGLPDVEHLATACRIEVGIGCTKARFVPNAVIKFDDIQMGSSAWMAFGACSAVFLKVVKHSCVLSRDLVARLHFDGRGH